MAAVVLLLILAGVTGLMPQLWGPVYLFTKIFFLNFFLVYLVILIPVLFLLRNSEAEESGEMFLRYVVTAFFIKSVFYVIAGNADWGVYEYLFLPTIEAGFFTVSYLSVFRRNGLHKYLKILMCSLQLIAGITAAILLVYRLFVFSWITLLLSLVPAVFSFLYLSVVHKQGES